MTSGLPEHMTESLNLRKHRKSRELFDRAKQTLAGGVSSQFRAHERPHPFFYVSAKGSRIWDADGNEYVDFTLAQGPMFLGHSYPVVIEAVREAMTRGQLFAGQHQAELELAESLKRLIPCAELVRFSLSGSEAVHAAIRLSRAYTRRAKLVKFEGHYHGWFDEVSFSVSPTEAEAGPARCPRPVPWTQGIAPRCDQNLIVLPWNDLGLLEEVFPRSASDIAAVICEPVMCNSGCIPPEPGYLEGLRQLCDQYGIVLIFDEVITGFRLGLSGAQGYYKVVPDLAVLGKAMANGFPISAVVGRRKLMELFATGQAIHAGTMNAQNITVAAALATIRELEAHSPGIYNRVFKMAEELRAGLSKSASSLALSVTIQGVGPVFHLGFTSAGKIKDYRETLTFDQEKYRRFVAAMQERGVRLIGRGLWYLSTIHNAQDIQHCLKAADESLAAIGQVS